MNMFFENTSDDFGKELFYLLQCACSRNVTDFVC